MKKVCVVGCFADGFDLVNGQTVKTKIVFHELSKSLGDDLVMKMDTYGGIKTLIKSPAMIFKALKNADNIIILPAENGLRVIAPILIGLNVFFRRHVYYDVIGGWLPSFAQKRKWLSFVLKHFNTIYVETDSMKRELEGQGFQNVDVIPNCKELTIIKEREVRVTKEAPFRLCTFSRVMKEKGIEDAVMAVIDLNLKLQGNIFELDIFGQIDGSQVAWFESLKETFPNFINYKGVVQFSKSTDTLKEYDALLFPTYYEGEGFAGTIIDSFAAGVPVIASDWKYNQEIVNSGITGLIFETHNVNALKNAIEEIRIDIEKWNLIKRNCVREAEKFQPANAMKKLIEKIQRK